METRVHRDRPTDIYLSFVTSLFGNRRTLFVSMGVQVLCYLLVFAQSGDLFYLYLSSALLSVMALRGATFASFHRASPATLAHEALTAWERRYLVGAVTATCIMGLAAGHAIYVLRNPFAELVCVAVAMVAMASVVGRNYGSPMAVNLQSLSMCLPILVACVARGDIYMLLFGILLVALSAVALFMASGVRQVLANNVLASREVAQLADSFETALDNMTQGLLMLDEHNRIQVINRRACELLKLGKNARLKDCDIEAILTNVTEKAMGGGTLAGSIRTQLMQLIDGTIDRAVLAFADDAILEFSANHQSRSGVVLTFEDVTARVHGERKILHMLRHDGLTGLPNRSYFADLVSQKLEEGVAGNQIGFLLLDINDFKHVNDLKGHSTGDRLLAAVAARLTTEVGTSGIVLAHLLGDRFILFFADKGDANDLAGAMSAFHARTAGQYQVDGTSFRVIMSGGAVVLPATGFDSEGWQTKVDLALYTAKSRGKGTLSFFAEEMDARYIEREKLKSDLREAVERQELSVLYQPMYRPDGSELVCCEALSRWNHPTRGPISPATFIEIAEEIGIVSDITRLMIARACADCVTWPEQVSVSVNLSEHDLRSPDILETVKAALARTGLAASRLHLEVTESSLIEELSAVSLLLQEMRRLGIRIAIDDFGTGFSSLSYLDQLPLDIIKIDRSFVRNITADARRLSLLRGIVHLARRLNLEIVVEGVETEAQLALVNDYECADLVQGYIFSRPVEASFIKELERKARTGDLAEKVA